MVGAHFQGLAPAAFPGMQLLRHRAGPSVFRGMAAHWPAVQHWSFARLAERAPDVQIKLVAGNRERGRTCFIHSTLGSYLASLEESHDQRNQADQALYLKEFDLLDTIPALRQDLRHADLFVPGSTFSLQSWIGPAHARTGLHYDYLDNLAVQIVGRKRFYLVRAGTVERMHAVAGKYDSWARLATCTAQELAARAETHTETQDNFFVVDLEPGDVLHVPAGWWHEVLNLTPCILFGGFHGLRAQVAARWAWVQSRDLLHRLGWLGHGNCTCHPAP